MGVCLFLYLRDVIPFREMILPSVDPRGLRDEGFLFSNSQGGCWKTDILTKAMTETSTKWASFRCTTQMYRHIVKAINRKFIRGPAIEDGRDDDELAVTEQEAAHDLMQCHSIKTGNTRYGLTSQLWRGLSDTAINVFGEVSNGMAKYYGLLPRLPRNAVISNQWSMVSRHNGTAIDQCERGLKILFGNSGHWKSDQQRNVVRSVISGEPQVLVVLPTAEGKSLCFQIPAVLKPRETSIVIVPLIELARSMVEECIRNRIHAIQWESAEEERVATVVVVSVNMSITPAFRKYASDLHHKGVLARQVLDEVHYKYIISEGFRPEFEHIGDLCLPVQIVCMSATFPVFQEPQLMMDLSLHDLKVFRSSTNRPQIKYVVEVVKNKEWVEKYMVNWVRKYTATWSTEKGLVYCKGIKALEMIAKELCCGLYHSKYSKKEEDLKSWMEGKGKILCATGALSAGINVKNIPLVIHCGLPWGISDFVQESGRGGRDGESVLSVIFLSEKEMSELRSNAGFAMEVQGIADFVTTDLCRRLVITQYMDGKPKRCVDLVGSIPCDNCQKAFDQSAEGQFKRTVDASFIPEEIRQVKFQKRITSQLSVLATNGERRSKIEKAARRLNGHCGACWLANNGVNYEHSYKKCRAAEQLLGLDSYVLYQSTVPKSGGIVCYKCRLPSTWCAGYKATDLNNMKNVCELTDAVSSMVAVGFVMKIEKVREMCGPIIKDLKEFMEWMQGVTVLGGSKCTNALLVFEQLC